MADALRGIALDGRAAGEARPGRVVIQAGLDALRLPQIPPELVEVEGHQTPSGSAVEAPDRCGSRFPARSISGPLILLGESGPVLSPSAARSAFHRSRFARSVR